MLQLPDTARRSPSFSKAHMADIKRGAKVVVRDLSSRPDLIAGELLKFKALLKAYDKASVAMEKAKTTLTKCGAMYAGVEALDPEDRRALAGTKGPFYLEERIVSAVAYSRKILREDLAWIRKLPKYSRTGPDAQTMVERDQRVASNKRRLAHLPAVQKKLIKELRVETRRVGKIQRNVGWLRTHRNYTAAIGRVRQSFEKMATAPLTSVSGAIDLIDLAGIAMESQVVYLGEVKPVMAKVAKFLARKSLR